MLTFAGKTATSSATSQIPAAGRVRANATPSAAGDLRRAADEDDLVVRRQGVRDDLLEVAGAQEVQDPGRDECEAQQPLRPRHRARSPSSAIVR